MNPPAPPENGRADDAVLAIERPAPALLVYYSLLCAVLIPLLPVALVVWLVNYFRYRTLRYRFDDQGISMRWGILFRREILLNYARIQDIHLVSNILERHLGLARIQVQTASGSATPEMTIEGLHEFEAVRDFLYARMRGTRDAVGNGRATTPEAASPGPVGDGSGAPVPSAAPPMSAELAGVLREIAVEIREIRRHLESGGGR